MADTCYGQPDTELSDPSTFVVDEEGSVTLPAAAPAFAPSSLAGDEPCVLRESEQPAASRQADGHAILALPNEPAAESEPTATPRGLAGESAADTGEPRLALEQMTLVIDGGMLMVLGPERDPVPPQAFAHAAGLRPDLRLGLPDGKAVRADRVAAVLAAQALGRLGAAERGDGWILMMLGQGDGPEPASRDGLRAERDDGPEPAPEDALDAERGHCVLTLFEGQMLVAIGGHAFRIIDLAPGASTPAAMRLMLDDDASISVTGLSARLGGQTARPAVRGNAADVEIELGNEGEAARPRGSDRLVIPGCTMELRPEGLRLGAPGLATPGEGFRLARQTTDGLAAPLVSVVSTTGDAVPLEDLIDLSLADGRMPATGPGSELDDVDHEGRQAGGRAELANDRTDRTGHPGDDSGADLGADADHDAASRQSHAPNPISPGDAAPDDARSDQAALDEAALDEAASDRGVVDPVAGGNQDALSRVELDFGDLFATCSSPLDLDNSSSRGHDLDFSADSLDFPTVSLDGKPDDQPAVADGESVRDDTLPASAGELGGAGAGCEVSGQVTEGVLAAVLGPVDPVDLMGQSRGCDPADPGMVTSTHDGVPDRPCLAEDRPDGGGTSVTADIHRAAHQGKLAQQGDDPAEDGVRARSIATASVRTVSDQVDVDPESIALVVIRGVPEDATLSTGTRDEDGSWSISPLDLSSVMISLASQGPGSEPPVVEGDLDITGIAFTEQGELVAISETVPLADYVDEPTSSETGAIEPVNVTTAGPNPPMLSLDIDSRSWADEQFDALVVRDLPPGARLSAGSYDPSIDGWVLMAQDLPMLAMAPPAGMSTDFTLTLMGVALRPGDANAARVLARLPVTRR